jgi:hypothetical protein
MDFRDEVLEKLILDGIVEFAGVDSEGELLYSFSDDIVTKSPGIYQMVMDMRLRDIRDLWAMGFLKMDITDKNPSVTLTEQAFDPSATAKLNKDLAIALMEIKSLMRDRDV